MFVIDKEKQFVTKFLMLMEPFKRDETFYRGNYDSHDVKILKSQRAALTRA